MPARRDRCPSNLPAVAHPSQLPTHPDLCQEQGLDRHHPFVLPHLPGWHSPGYPVALVPGAISACCHHSLVLPVSPHWLDMDTGQGTSQSSIWGSFPVITVPSSVPVTTESRQFMDSLQELGRFLMERGARHWNGLPRAGWSHRPWGDLTDQEVAPGDMGQWWAWQCWVMAGLDDLRLFQS